MPFLTEYMAGEMAKKLKGKFYVAAYTVAPTVTTAGVEVVGHGYRRELAVIDATADRATNDHEIAFEVASGDWGSVVAVGVCDSEKAGHLLWFSPTDPQPISLNHQLRIPKGKLHLLLNR